MIVFERSALMTEAIVNDDKPSVTRALVLGRLCRVNAL